MTNGLSALEHEVLPVNDVPGPLSVSTAEAELLSAYSVMRPGFCSRGHRSIRLANYAGLINLGGRMLEVLPKIEYGTASAETCRGVLLRLLALAEDLPIKSFGPAEHELRSGALLDVFVSAFYDEVGKVLRGGLLRRYQVREEELPMIRGRLLIGRQIRAHGMRPDRLACRFDELSADNDWNRVLKTALACVKRHISSLPSRKLWSELWPAFDEVEVLREPADAFKRLSPDRQVARYAAAVRWARRIISVLTPNLRVGTKSAPGLLFDTNRLFERAIAKKLAIALSDGGTGLRLATQVRGRYLARVAGTEMIGLRPDLVVMNGERTVAIADTKWKCVGMRNGYLEPSEKDVYQLLAYAAAFRCAETVLIYPWHEGVAQARETVLELPEVHGLRPRITVMCIDVFEDDLPIKAGFDNEIGKALMP